MLINTNVQHIDKNVYYYSTPTKIKPEISLNLLLSLSLSLVDPENKGTY